MRNANTSCSFTEAVLPRSGSAGRASSRPPSQLAWLEQRLGAVADAQDVDRTTSDLEKDAVNSPPLAVKQLAQLSGIPRAFGSQPTPLRIVLQGVDGLQELLVPPEGSRTRPLSEPFQGFVDLAQCPGGDPDRVGHPLTRLCGSA